MRVRDKIYEIKFDEVILNQLANVDGGIKKILSKMFDRIENKGPKAGKMIDSKLFIYGMKNKRPPIRLYFKHLKNSKEIWLFEYEMKTSEKKQKRTIGRIKDKIFRLFKLKS
ncbi:MAG: hypothetical protein CMH63_02480 [Nanoarchaeota archaeon]|jgi:hypothetical protein|nr:hypothetical protein [Nanoarchaeota archaeon]|tara:strand:+ start:460 stop:795 length:336 start_codon:yes stop_codon:yes gene_type:complete